MTSRRVPPAPVSQQVPPARAAACDGKPLRDARGPLLLITGTGSRRDTSPEDRAWKEGYRAGRLGMSYKTCPYPAEQNLESLSWISGYIEGKGARLAKPKSCS
jgi:ribosome modulation factor